MSRPVAFLVTDKQGREYATLDEAYCVWAEDNLGWKYEGLFKVDSRPENEVKAEAWEKGFRQAISYVGEMYFPLGFGEKAVETLKARLLEEMSRG